MDALVNGKMSAPAGDETQCFNVITIDEFRTMSFPDNRGAGGVCETWVHIPDVLNLHSQM